MVENDKIYKNLSMENLSKSKSNKSGTKSIIVGKNAPSSIQRGILSYYNSGFEYDNEIAYIQANIFG